MLQARNCELTAIAGRSIAKAEDFKNRFGFRKAYDSYDRLLADPEIEAVYIPLPNTLHREWTLRALRAKKHVLCEKPLAPTEAEAAELLAAAKENGVVLMEAFAYLHSPFMQAVLADIRSGILGELNYIESEFLTSDYVPENIRMRRETCGGALYDLGCYTVGQILRITGTEPTQAVAVSSFSDRGIDTLTTGILTFEGSLRAQFTCGMVLATEQDRRNDRLLVYGTKGKLVSSVEFNQCGALSYTVTTDEGTVTRTVDARQNYALEVEQLGRCITHGEAPFVSGEYTLMLARTMDRLLTSMNYR